MTVTHSRQSSQGGKHEPSALADGQSFTVHTIVHKQTQRSKSDLKVTICLFTSYKYDSTSWCDRTFKKELMNAWEAKYVMASAQCSNSLWSAPLHLERFAGLPLFWTSASKRGFQLPDVVRLLSRKTAQLCSLDNQKGSLAPDYDADLVIWDPEREFEVSISSWWFVHFYREGGPMRAQFLKQYIFLNILLQRLL